MKEYKKLQRTNDYDKGKAEELAEAVMELREIQRREAYLEELIADNEELKHYVWTTAEGVTKPVHMLDDDHLKNIMTHVLNNGSEIGEVIKAEARSRSIEIPAGPPKIYTKVRVYNPSEVDLDDIDF